MKFKKIALVLILLSTCCYTQEIVNARFEQQDEKIIIYYDLKGDPGKEYNVTDIVLKNYSEATFQIKPDDLSGAVGEGKFAGINNKIIWNVNRQEQNLLSMFADGEEFYFQFTVTPVNGGIPWYYYIGGSVLAGGGAAVLILSKKPMTETPPVETNKYPVPPGRP